MKGESMSKTQTITRDEIICNRASVGMRLNKREQARYEKMCKDNEEYSKRICTAIKALAEDDSALENFELYLSRFFTVWLRNHGSTPEDLTEEFELFAHIDRQEVKSDVIY